MEPSRNKPYGPQAAQSSMDITGLQKLLR